MNDNISQDNSRGMTDAQLDRLLDELETPPAPSDLLRARLHADPLRASPRDDAAKGGPAGTPDATGGGRFSERRALYARIAATLCLAAVVGMASWLPAPGPARDGAVARLAVPVAPFAAPAPRAWELAGNQGGSETLRTGPALSLVGGDGAAIGGIGLVQAAWSGGAGADAVDGGELDDIPLD
ncbi:MAG: hypothetical protein OEO83_07095 [Alphaproteobacteria bacterium]|nr:hypothetical protein [Alphaproteobacteria bacterium]